MVAIAEKRTRQGEDEPGNFHAEREHLDCRFITAQEAGALKLVGLA